MHCNVAVWNWCTYKKGKKPVQIIWILQCFGILSKWAIITSNYCRQLIAKSRDYLKGNTPEKWGRSLFHQETHSPLVISSIQQAGLQLEDRPKFFPDLAAVTVHFPALRPKVHKIFPSHSCWNGEAINNVYELFVEFRLGKINYKVGPFSLNFVEITIIVIITELFFFC